VIGGGCTFNADGSAGSQAVPVGGTAVLRKFVNSATLNGLDPNQAYFRSNEKFQQFQWAAYPGGSAATTGGIISAINSCKTSATALGGKVAYAACQHWNTADTGINCVTTAGNCNVATDWAGGRGTLPTNFGPVVTQIGQWIGKGQWNFGVASYASLAGVQLAPQTLGANGNCYENNVPPQPSVSTMSIPGTGGSNSITVQVSRSGGPDLVCPGTVNVVLGTTTNLPATPAGNTASASFTAAACPPGNSCTLTQVSFSQPATLTVTIAAGTAPGTYTVVINAIETWPAPPAGNGVTIVYTTAITVTVT